MKVFYLTLISTFLLGIASRIHPKWDKNKKPMLFFILLILIILVGVSGLRRSMGDTGDYKHLYSLVVQGEDMTESSYEVGFIKFFEILSKISPDPQIMVFTTALITTVLFIMTLRKYYSFFELEVYMYITSGFYLVTMNGIRQAMAASFVFAGTRFIVEKNLKAYLAVILFASTFHTSALIMIPVYFIAREEAWSKKVIHIIIVSGLLLLFIQPVMTMIFESAEGTKLGGYEEAILGGGEGGASIFRTIIAAVPVILSYIYRDKIKEVWPESNIFVNMCLVNFIIMSFALYNWLFARFNFYFQPYSFILLPYLIKNIFKAKEKGLVYYSFIICYFIFFYYEHVISLNVIYSSDFINL